MTFGLSWSRAVGEDTRPDCWKCLDVSGQIRRPGLAVVLLSQRVCASRLFSSQQWSSSRRLHSSARQRALSGNGRQVAKRAQVAAAETRAATVVAAVLLNGRIVAVPESGAPRHATEMATATGMAEAVESREASRRIRGRKAIEPPQNSSNPRRANSPIADVRHCRADRLMPRPSFGEARASDSIKVAWASSLALRYRARWRLRM